ncbi:MAG: SWIM zinc finger family protein [Nanoarchaeota archaeon]
MIKTIKDITIEDIQDLFDSVIHLRGEEYFEEGLVISIEPLNTNTITGIVRGNQNYTVSVTIDDGNLICDCSCPCDFDCKHAAALLLKWLSIKNKQSASLKEGIPKAKESLQQSLAAKNKEELIDLLKAAIDKYPALKSLVHIERKAILSQIKNLFSEYWEWDEIQDLIFQLETILEGIRRNKASWDRNLWEEMKVCSEIMIKNIENVHDEGNLGIFWKDWFETYGEIFASTKPNKKEKVEFIQVALHWIERDDYGNEGSFEKALVGLCSTSEDVELIKEMRSKIKKKEYDEEDRYEELFLKLYEKAGMEEKYLEEAMRSGFTKELVDKLISLNRLEEALEACNKNKTKELSPDIEIRRLQLLRNLGQTPELKKSLLMLTKKLGNITYALQLKQESSAEEWRKYSREIINYSRNNNQHSFLSRFYYEEKDFKNAHEYSKNLRDAAYLELLAKKLSKEHPELASDLFKKLCFYFIGQGSGWPYQKAGKMLEALKKTDNAGGIFRRTKGEIVKTYGKKYSLMAIIEGVK